MVFFDSDETSDQSPNATASDSWYAVEQREAVEPNSVGITNIGMLNPTHTNDLKVQPDKERRPRQQGTERVRDLSPDSTPETLDSHSHGDDTSNNKS